MVAGEKAEPNTALESTCPQQGHNPGLDWMRDRMTRENRIMNSIRNQNQAAGSLKSTVLMKVLKRIG